MKHCSKLVSTSATTAFVAAGLLLAACGGNSHKAATSSIGGGGITANATVSVAHFCRDYTAADDAYQQTLGDVTDPQFAVFLSSLTQAQAEAPAAVKGDVTTMLNEAKRAKSGANGIDLSAPSARVSAWADSNCSAYGSYGNTGNSTDPDTSSNAVLGCAGGRRFLERLLLRRPECHLRGRWSRDAGFKSRFELAVDLRLADGRDERQETPE